MSALDIIFAILVILSGVSMVILFLVQEGNDKGMGVVGGASSDSFYSKAKGRTLEERLKQATKVTAVLFAAFSVILYILVTKGL